MVRAVVEAADVLVEAGAAAAVAVVDVAAQVEAMAVTAEDEAVRDTSSINGQ